MSMTMTALSCPTCGTEIERKGSQGQPPTYCSIKCRRKDQRSTSERHIPCVTCGILFTTRRPNAKYCTPACRNPNAKRCSLDGCQRPHLAKGRCGMHWQQKYGTRAKVAVPCSVCGTETQKEADSRRRPVCSPECRRFLQFDKWPACTIPDTHPVLSTRIPDDHPARRRPRTDWISKTYRIYIPDRRWCGKAFVTQQPHQVHCSKRCTRREVRARRKALEHGASGSYTWTEVIGLFLKFGRRCAYCRQPITGQPDPDHVVPLSRGGSNSLTNILPSCRTCNSEKCDRTLTEWALAREAKGQPPRITSWETGDPLYVHLALSAPTRPRWNAA